MTPVIVPPDSTPRELHSPVDVIPSPSDVGEEIVESLYSSYVDVLSAENPTGAFAEIATDPLKAEGFLRDAEYEVAKAASELELGLRLGTEKETFDQALRQHASFLGLKIMHDIAKMPDDTLEVKVKKQVIDTILASEESILTLENDIRLDNSFVEKGKEIVASSRLRRFLGELALAGTSVAFTSLSIKYGADLLPRDAEEALHNPTNFAAAAGAGAIVAERALSRWFGDKISEAGADSFDEYTPAGESSITTKKLFKIHQEQITDTRHELHDIAINQFHGDEARSTEMVATLLSVLRDKLLNAYEAEDVREVTTMTKKGAMNATKAFGTGLVAVLGMSEVAAEQLFANIPTADKHRVTVLKPAAKHKA